MGFFTYPDLQKLSTYHRNYLQLLDPEIPLLTTLEEQRLQLDLLCREIYKNKGNFSYEKDKWSLFEILVHIIDWERIMLFRIMSISRDLGNPLPSLDQDHVMSTSRADERSLDDLVADWHSSRTSTIYFLTNLNFQDISRKGEVSSYQISANDLTYVHVGHVAHHMKILDERYFPG
ncbi:MAG: hypothetical protein RL124_556 [Acidobacteriota bacterium]|jgi:hypothetical protein